MKANGKAKLSPWPYIKHNKRRMIALIISLSVFAVMLYAVCYIIDCTTKPFYEVKLNKYDSENIVSIKYTDDTVKKNEKMTDEEYTKLFWDRVYENFEKDREKLKSVEHVDDVLMYKSGMLRFRSIMGEMSTPIFLFENTEDINTLFNHEKLKLIKGRMPQTRGEIVVDKKIADNQGDDLLNSLAEGYKVVGYVDSDKYISFGYAQENENNGWILFLTNQRTSVQKGIKNLGIDVISYSDYDSVKKDLKNEVGSFESVKMVFALVSNIILSICIMVVLALHISDRHNEWCLISSIGFAKIDIYVMALKELLVAFISGIVLGIGLGYGCAELLDKLSMKPLGIHVSCLSIEGIKFAVIMIMIIFGLCQIPLFVNLNKVTTVDEIEE